MTYCMVLPAHYLLIPYVVGAFNSFHYMFLSYFVLLIPFPFSPYLSIEQVKNQQPKNVKYWRVCWTESIAVNMNTKEMVWNQCLTVCKKQHTKYSAMAGKEYQCMYICSTRHCPWMNGCTVIIITR